MVDLPTITVATPSYNQTRFLRKRIESVLGQGYDALEYIVMDGGSTDGSAAVIREYADCLAFSTSDRDAGADAINKGFSGEPATMLPAGRCSARRRENASS